MFDKLRPFCLLAGMLLSACGAIGAGTESARSLIEDAIQRDEEGLGVSRPDQYWVELRERSSITPGGGGGVIAMVGWTETWDPDVEIRDVDWIEFYGECATDCSEVATTSIAALVQRGRPKSVEGGACGNCESSSSVSFFEIDGESVTDLDRADLAAAMSPIDTEFEAGLLLGNIHSVLQRDDGWRVVVARQQDPHCSPITTTYEVWDVTVDGALELLAEQTVERDPSVCA